MSDPAARPSKIDAALSGPADGSAAAAPPPGDGRAAQRAAVVRTSAAIPCGYFDAGVCRSCSLLDVDYATQLAGKQARVRELIDGFAEPGGPGIEWRDPVASDTAGFRTKAKLVVGGTTDSPTLGILDRAHRGVDLEACPIVAAPIRAALPRLAAFITTARLVPYDVPTRRGELKYVIVTANARGELMLRLVLRSTESVLRIRKHLPALRADLPQLRVATVNLLPEHKAVLEGDDELALTGETALELPFDGLTLRLLPRSFVQTNEGVAARLYRTGAAWAAGLAPRSAWDLYCGVGGFALHLASAFPSPSVPRWSNGAAGARIETVHITGVERNDDAVASAALAAEAAGLDVSFVAADAIGWARAQASAPELVIVNPPRRGIGAELATWLEASGVQHVLYSSCNAESLARDLAAMPGLTPVRAQLFDMFPHTAHSETLVLLGRRS